MASGQTTVIYGNWSLTRCQTLDFKQEPVYDDLSQTDLMYFKYTVRVLGYIHGITGWCQLQTPVTTNDGVNGTMESASLIHVGMRVNLPPRQAFSYRIGADSTGISGGYVDLYAEPAIERPIGITHLDVNNGPRCNSFVVKRVVSDNVFEVEAEFEVCKVECQVDASVRSQSGASPNVAGTVPVSKVKGILSNRWRVIDDIDTNLKTIRTYSGRLRTASNNIDPNAFRSYVTPPLVNGMRRDKIHFEVSPDGLNLDYTIIDVEVAYSAPYPATKWSIQHTESVDQALVCRGSLDITLQGPRGVNKGDLISIAMNLIQARLLGTAPNQAESKHYMESLSITDFIGEDQIVSVSASIMRLSPRANGKKADAFLDWRVATGIIGRVVTKDEVNEVTDVDTDYDSDKSYGGRDEAVPSGGWSPNGEDGTSPVYEGPIELIGMYLPYLQSPCNDLHKIVPDGDELRDNENITPNSEPKTTVTAKVNPTWTETDDTLYSSSTTSNIYIHWVMESIYKERSMKLSMPVAKSHADAYGGYTNKLVTLAAPQARRIVRAVAERVGAWPEMPSDTQIAAIVGNTPGISQTVLGKKRRFATPFYTAGGQKAYRMGIDFYLSLDKMPSAGDTLAVGRSMWTTDGNIATSSAATNGWT